ncbi:hypothetical protein WBG78_21765 [Chryseolinea sp. T2]|uniref:hypothetical protein n=1 Tax=Chryseolinea sp. T2 TaxID=3129255 RepID=UPI003077F498
MNENENRNTDNSNVSGSLVPPQRSGKAIDASAFAVLSTEKTANFFFELVKNRMQHVNSWSVIAGKLSAEFQLVNKEGLEVFRKAQEGDYLRIDVMGPGGTSGKGYDWVKIEELSDDADMYGFRVRPSSQPATNRSGPDHFYDDESTSTFQVIRKGQRVVVTISDRNIKPNNDTANVVDKVRNHMVAWAARARFSEIQWQALAEGLVSR